MYLVHLLATIRCGQNFTKFWPEIYDFNTSKGFSWKKWSKFRRFWEKNYNPNHQIFMISSSRQAKSTTNSLSMGMLLCYKFLLFHKHVLSMIWTAAVWPKMGCVNCKYFCKRRYHSNLIIFLIISTIYFYCKKGDLKRPYHYYYQCLLNWGEPILRFSRPCPHSHLKCTVRASPPVLSMWPCNLQLDEEKSKHVGLAQEIGFLATYVLHPTYVVHLLRLVNVEALLTC